jgi:hypothetical protein
VASVFEASLRYPSVYFFDYFLRKAQLHLS